MKTQLIFLFENKLYDKKWGLEKLVYSSRQNAVLFSSFHEEISADSGFLQSPLKKTWMYFSYNAE